MPASRDRAATSHELKPMAQQGAEASQRHADRISSLLKQAGGQPNGRPNAVMDGIQSAAREMREAAKDDAVRDAAIIASAQLALHCYTAPSGFPTSPSRARGATRRTGSP